MAEEGTNSPGYSALQDELTRTQQELYLAKSDLERAEGDRKNLSIQVASILSEAEEMKARMREFSAQYHAQAVELEQQKKEAFDFKSELITCTKDLAAAGVMLEGAQKVTDQERKARADAEKSLLESQKQQEALQKELDELRAAIPSVQAQAVEDFCNAEGPLQKISDSFIAGFYTCKETALQHPDGIADLEVPSEIDVAPELEVKISEKRGDSLAILQLLRAEEPDIQAKWETGDPSPSKVGEEGADEVEEQKSTKE